ncbi:MAG: hypothetical protein KBT46_08735, partial [Ruminococcus sp.]|nr:hypothetical protein [Candidatus Copronaster equi]
LLSYKNKSSIPREKGTELNPADINVSQYSKNKNHSIPVVVTVTITIFCNKKSRFHYKKRLFSAELLHFMRLSTS